MSLQIIDIESLAQYENNHFLTQVGFDDFEKFKNFLKDNPEIYQINFFPSLTKELIKYSLENSHKQDDLQPFYLHLLKTEGKKIGNRQLITHLIEHHHNQTLMKFLDNEKPGHQKNSGADFLNVAMRFKNDEIYEYLLVHSQKKFGLFKLDKKEIFQDMMSYKYLPAFSMLCKKGYLDTPHLYLIDNFLNHRGEKNDENKYHASQENLRFCLKCFSRIENMILDEKILTSILLETWQNLHEKKENIISYESPITFNYYSKSPPNASANRHVMMYGVSGSGKTKFIQQFIAQKKEDFSVAKSVWAKYLMDSTLVEKKSSFKTKKI